MSVELHIVQPNGSGNPIHLRHRRIDKDTTRLDAPQPPRNLARRLRRDIAAAARAEGEDTLPAEQALGRAIDTFFDAVMVMDKDARVKENRLSLLKMIDDDLLETADYSKIVLN